MTDHVERGATPIRWFPAPICSDAEVSSEQPYPFAHARAPKAGPRLRGVGVESDSVVAYRQQQAAILEREVHNRNGGLGVARDISQRLLRHAKEAQSDIVRQPVGYLVQFDIDPHGLASRNMLAFCFQCLCQAQVVQNRRMKPVRESVHIFAQAH